MLRRLMMAGASTPPATYYRDAVASLSPLWYYTLGDASGSGMVAAQVGASGTYLGTPTLGSSALLPNDPATSMYSSAYSSKAKVVSAWDGTGDFSVSMVFKSSQHTAQQWALIDQETAASSDKRMAIVLNRGSAGTTAAGQICLFNFDGTTNRHFASTSLNVTDDAVHHAVVGRASGVGFMTVDGVDVPTAGAIATGDIYSGTFMGLGQSLVYGGTPCAAYSCHYAFWTRALTPTERTALFAATGL